MRRRTITVKARNLTEACIVVERSLKPGEKYYKFATVIGNPDADGLLQIVFSDEKMFEDVA